MDAKSLKFNKYDKMGAYHWTESDRNAKQYNPPLEAKYRLVTDKIIKMNGIKRVLDVGCGDGYIISKIGLLSDTVVGVDVEKKALDWARIKLKTYVNCQLLQASAYNLPFADASFDLVLLLDVIEHLHEPDRCLGEIKKTLKSNGVLLLTTPKWRPDRMWDDCHVKEYQPDELCQYLKHYFNKIEMTYFWPMVWLSFYTTKLGWRVVKSISRHLCNPFLKQSFSQSDRYGQIMALCKGPK